MSLTGGTLARSKATEGEASERLKLEGMQSSVSRPTTRAAVPPSDPARLSSSSEQKSSSRRTASSVSGDEGTTSSRAGHDAAVYTEREPSRRRAKDLPAESEAGGGTEARAEVLSLFSPSQFVYDEAQFGSLAEAVSSGPGLLDLFSGARGFSKAFVKLRCPWAVCFDLKHSQREDLSVLASQLQSCLPVVRVSTQTAGRD